MPHDMNPSEERKFEYLLRTYLLLWETLQESKKEKHRLSFFDAADSAGWYYDWEPVIRFCAPEVLVVMSDDRRDRARIPTYAVVPRTSDWFPVTKEIALSASESTVAVPEIEGRDQLLERMQKMINTLPTERVGEANKHLRALRRIIRLDI